MGEFSIANRLEVVQDLVGYMLGGAWGFLGAVAVLAFLFTVVRAAVLGNTKDPIAWGLRLLLVVAVLASYRPIVSTLIGASDDLASHFMDRADWHRFSQQISEQFVPMFQDERIASGEMPGVVDRVLGVLRGGLLTTVTAVTYYLVFLVYDTLRDLTAVIFGLLVVAGPLLVAGGVIADGRTLKQWFGSLIQVALWPVVPPFMMMIIVGTSGLAAQTGNTAYVIQQNVALLFLTLLTPLIVAFMVGRGGVATLAAGVTGAAVGLALGGAKLAAAPIQKEFERLAAAERERLTAANDARMAEDRGSPRRPGERPAGEDVAMARGRGSGGAPRAEARADAEPAAKQSAPPPRRPPPPRRRPGDRERD